MTFNDNGVIEPGIHEIDIHEFYNLFVQSFTTSERRKDIFDSLIDFLKILLNKYDVQEVWIDGSYVTDKVNPNDVDIIVFLEIEDYINIHPLWPSLRCQKNIDPYCEVILNEHTKSAASPKDLGIIINQRNYWRGQFGFDRIDIPKGIIKLSGHNIKEYISGGEPYVI